LDRARPLPFRRLPRRESAADCAGGGRPAAIDVEGAGLPAAAQV